MESGPLSVAVLSQYALVRAGLTSMVRGHADRAVVVETASHDGHLGALDVVVFDLAGLTSAFNRGDLAHVLRNTPVLGLARDERDDLVDGAHALGVRHIVPEHVESDALLDALERAAGRAAVDAPAAGLTEREHQVLVMVASGMTNADICQRLVISPNTVKTYIRLAYRKIGARTRTQAVLWAVDHGLVADDQDGPAG